jgi:hypothetical protein
MSTLGAALATAIDGHRCLDHVREIGHYDRSLGSSGYHASAEYVMGALGRMGLQTRTVPWPMDDKPVPWNWDVPFAWEPHAAVFKVLAPEERTLVNFLNTPTCLHPWSAATPPDGQAAEIVYVGAGTTDADYEGKNVRGKIVFADRGANWLLYVHAIQKRGALGYLSDDILAIPKVKTRERYPDMVLWYTFYEREFGTRGPIRGWGFSISPRMGDYLRGLLRRGPVKGHALVQARTFSGVMENVLGSIEGEDAAGEEFLCMAHLDHYRPGAMDNAAGCAALMEAADALNRLIEAGTIPKPRRSIRFLFGPEGHMSNVYPHSLGNGLSNIVGSWTADTVGAKPHVTGGPLLLARASAATPTFLDDLGTTVLKESCAWYPAIGEEPGAAADSGDSPVHARTASAFKYDTIRYGIYSDNSVLAGWGVPATGIFQWPSIIWHTQYDTIDKLDVGELARCAWATATVSYQVAAAGPNEALIWMHDVAGASRRRLAAIARRARHEVAAGRTDGAGAALSTRLDALRYQAERDAAAIASCVRLARPGGKKASAPLSRQSGALAKGVARQAEAEASALRGVAKQLGVQTADGPAASGGETPSGALSRRPRRTRPGLINMKSQAIAFGPQYAPRDPLFMDRMAEMMNLSDGTRTISQIARILAHEIGPIEPDLVAEMYGSLETAGYIKSDG